MLRSQKQHPWVHRQPLRLKFSQLTKKKSHILCNPKPYYKHWDTQNHVLNIMFNAHATHFFFFFHFVYTDDHSVKRMRKDIQKKNTEICTMYVRRTAHDISVSTRSYLTIFSMFICMFMLCSYKYGGELNKHGSTHNPPVK